MATDIRGNEKGVLAMMREIKGKELIMTPEISSLITVLSVSFAVFSGVIAIRRNNKNDDQANAAQITTVIVKLENIGDDVKEIKENIKGLDEKIQQLDRRVTIVEQSTKSAHHRLDGLIDQEEDRNDG